MNYTKAQQNIVADILRDTARGVMHSHDAEKKRTTFFNPDGTAGYVIPDSQVVIDLKRCTSLERFPFTPCPADERLEIIHLGAQIKEPKRTLLVYETRWGPTFIDKKLLALFDAPVRLFQEKRFGVVTVAEERANAFRVVGYVCAVNYKPQNTQKT